MLARNNEEEIFLAVDCDRTAIVDAPHCNEKLLNKMLLDFIEYKKENIKGVYLCTHRCLETMKGHYDNFKKIYDQTSSKEFYKADDFLTYRVVENLSAVVKMPVIVSTPDDKKQGECGKGFEKLKEYEQGEFKNEELVKSGWKAETGTKNKQLLHIAQKVAAKEGNKCKKIIFIDDKEDLCWAAVEHAEKQLGWPESVKLEAYHMAFSENDDEIAMVRCFKKWFSRCQERVFINGEDNRPIPSASFFSLAQITAASRDGKQHHRVVSRC